MSHHTVKNSYQTLSERLNRYPLGAPPTELLFKILKMLFSEDEAGLVSQLPIKPFDAKKAAIIWKKPVSEARKSLDELADRGILVDIECQDGSFLYALPPPMAGFFEFSLMRIRDDIDQKLLSELFQQYITVEDEFMTQLFEGQKTQLGRAFVNELALPEQESLHVLDYERASEVIQTASDIGVGICYCRHKAFHAGTVCDAPMDNCMTFNTTASSLIRHEVARRVDKSEGMEILQQAHEHNLVQFGENVRENVNFICNCCGCCCEALIAQRRFSVLKPIHTTNYLPVIDEEACNGCRKCANICPVEAMTMASANDPKKPKRMKAILDSEKCLGCGVCVRVCDQEGISLVKREKYVIPPLNGVHKVVLMAIERGKFHELLFDRKDLVSHRVLGAIFGTVLKMPPVKRAMLTDQFRSRYLENILATKN